MTVESAVIGDVTGKVETGPRVVAVGVTGLIVGIGTTGQTKH